MNARRDPVSEAIGRLGASPLATVTRFDEPIGPLTTYRVGGNAAALVELSSIDQATALAEIVSATGVATVVIGRGSNLLVSDHGFPGIAVTLGPAFSAIDISGMRVVAGGAAKLPVVARTTVNAGLTGFEWAVGVPGSVGGAVRMNAGGHGAEIGDVLVAARVIDLARGKIVELETAALELGYRTSSITESQIVISVELELEAGSVEEGVTKMADIVQWRRANQPGGQNAGSVFTNPADDSAGRLIEQAGAKGLRVGTAHVSERHANFIQADEGGSAEDIFELMRRVREIVLDAHGVVLHAETRLVGFAEHPSRGD